ncbi:hypothetical protein RCC30_23035 [Pseudomonas fluorescens]|nr:hypothetical protein RCC30_23035 [Pseudomonas fluorescens]
MSDGGAIWKLNFSASEQPGRFALKFAFPELGYVAEAKPMVLGHNKVRIHALREAAVDPVVGQAPAWLWVQVYSHFTDRPVELVPVKWWDGMDGTTTSTDPEGWSGFDFRPKTGGMHSVTALVDSYFDNFEDTRTVAVKAQLTDPWAGLMVSFDNKPAQPWGENLLPAPQGPAPDRCESRGQQRIAGSRSGTGDDRGRANGTGHTLR